LNAAFNEAVEDEEREDSSEDQDLRLMNTFIAKIRYVRCSHKLLTVDGIFI